MRIAITTIFKGSAFAGALPQVAFYLARALRSIGHDVNLLTNAESDSWFIDCKNASKEIPVVQLTEGASIQTYDLIVEVVWYLPVDLRRILATQVVMFYHYPPVFYDIECSVYPIITQPRKFEGLTGLWTWSHFAKTDFAYLELLTRLPVWTLPFVWDNILLDTYIKEANVPAVGPIGSSPTAVICETNMSNTSQCTLPLTIVSELYKNSGGKLQWLVLNSDVLVKRPFFKQNIIGNLHLPTTDLSSNFIRRVRLPDLCRFTNIIIAHQRFRPIKYSLLDALYLGIPLIHNCDLLQGVPGAEFHYSLNRIGKAIDRWNEIVEGKSKQNLSATRKALLERWGPAIIKAVLPGVIEKMLTAKPITASVLTESATPLRVGFFDMWVDFDPLHNLFLETMQRAGSVVLDQTNPELIVFGPFGKENERWPSVPKVYYTGENLPPLQRKDVLLNIGFKRDQDKSSYLRFPNWLLELNWFNQAGRLVKNPEPFDLDRLKITSEWRERFCIFVASNPGCVARNTLYHTLSRYRSVDSAGILYNNIPRLYGGPGGSGGQTEKVNFYKNYRFALVCENSANPGYVTEKILHARLAGCVPIYWGDTALDEEFNTAGVIQVSNYQSMDAFLERVRQIDTSRSEWLKMASQPLITEEKFANCKILVDTLGKRMCGLLKNTGKSAAGRSSGGLKIINEPQSGVATGGLKIINEPQSGVATGGVTSSVGDRYIDVQNKPYKQQILDVISHKKVIVTCCNKDYMPAAIRLVKSSTLPVYVWIWDMTDVHVEMLRGANPAGIIPFDTTWNPGWAEFWDPRYYAWKSLILVLASRVFNKGTQILYLDAGIEICNPLDKIWSSVDQTGIFVVEMPEHKMRTWSHPDFCRIMNMTPAELDAPQYSANIVGFEAGGKWSVMFENALAAACQKEVIIGHKWFRYSSECMGHRHDQSIISLTGRRAGVKPHLINDYVGHVSQHNTHYNGMVFYVHRQLWRSHKRIAEGIDEAFVINLAHREDRMKQFWASQPFMQAVCYRSDAVYGNLLTLTPEIVQLFRDNDFKWKKGVIGCALSHHNIWKRLVADTDVSTYLVMEDDAVLNKDFLNIWENMASLVPNDTDVIFLGGVLPPNKAALPMVTEQINPAFARVKQHNLFGGPPRRYFHFCTYSYIITKRGAAKLCELIEQRGIFTSIDHMMVNHGDGLLNIYFTTPLLASCIQESDPAYRNANFNDFNRADKFDSDIWNNKDCFSEIDIRNAVSGTATAIDEERSVKLSPLIVVYFEEHQAKDVIDSEWLQEIFQKDFRWRSPTEFIKSGSTVLIYYQHTTSVSTVEGWINRHMDCNLHLYHSADENLQAPVTLYTHPGIKTVFRNYWRPDVVGPKVVHLPLGYLNGKGRRDTTVPILSSRPYTWSFAGAVDRPERGDVLGKLKASIPNNQIYVTPTWKSALNLDAPTYTEMMRNSKFVPCMNGFWNTESYRFYEAIENGALPIVANDKFDSYKNLLTNSVKPPLLAVKEWKTVGDVMNVLSASDELLDREQAHLWQWWSGFKNYLKETIAARLK